MITRVVRNMLAGQITPIIIIKSIFQTAHTFPEVPLITLHGYVILYMECSACVHVSVCVYVCVVT